MGLEIIPYPYKCTGCRACEMACSFHHAKVFSRRLSSIKVSRNEKDRKIMIMIKKLGENESKPCDVCYNEKEPLCVKYCTKGALKVVDLGEETDE